jgi:hypothetical protein
MIVQEKLATKAAPFKGARSERPREGALIEPPRAVAGDRNRIAAGGGIVRRHAGHEIEALRADLQPLQSVGNAELGT